MSTYETSTAQLTSRIRQGLPGLDRTHDAVVDGLTSARLREVAAAVTAATVHSAEALAALWATAMTVLPDPAILPAPAAADLASARTLAEALLPAGTAPVLAGAAPLGQAHTALLQALTSTADAVGRTERLAVAQAATLSLPGLGYTVVRADADHATALEASKGHEKLLVLVTDGGTVTTDHAGLTDATCETRQDEFTAAMADHGVLLETDARVAHRDPRGGTPITAAARHRAATLAAGAVAEAERTYRRTATGTLYARPRQTGGGQQINQKEHS